ncbi:hypothetical protein [Pseudomonas syringae group genomosp. 7]|uniref:hypothetical protein n=1 Tax=Pseudomonas syringae group genomosp. 7 TaxID=251699 RepID=UPI0037700535
MGCGVWVWWWCWCVCVCGGWCGWWCCWFGGGLVGGFAWLVLLVLGVGGLGVLFGWCWLGCWGAFLALVSNSI